MPTSDRPPLDRPAGFGTVPCGLCRVHEARWVHPLDPDRAEFRVYGKGHVWGSPLSVCDRCDRLIRERDADGLVAACPDAAGLTGTDLDEQVGNRVRALVAADLGGHGITLDRPAGYAALVAEGFTPLENITGALHLARAWPAEHRRALAATDPDDASWLPDGQHWFVRSPWPSIPLQSLFGLVLRTLDATLDRQGQRFDEEQAVAAVRDLLSGSEQDIATLLADRRPPD